MDQSQLFDDNLRFSHFAL